MFYISGDGLKYFDFVQGKGEVAEVGKAVSVSFSSTGMANPAQLFVIDVHLILLSIQHSLVSSQHV